MKKADPLHEIVVLERNRPDDTFGWGVVFSDQTLENFRAADAETHDDIAANFAHWVDIDVHFKGTTITSGGHGFSGIARRKLLQILQRRARAVGADLRFVIELADDARLEVMGLGDADLVVSADGINSTIRRKYADAFAPDLYVGTARMIRLWTTFKYDAFTFYFIQNARGV